MISIEKARELAAIYNMEVTDVETRHDCKRYGKISDYIVLCVKYEHEEQHIFVYLSPDYKLVSDKAFYIECKVKNALFSVIQ